MLSFKKKTVLMLSLLTALALMMSACASKTDSGIDNDELSFLKQNNIQIKVLEMENYNEKAPETYLYTKLEISGLKNKDVQNKINRAISDKCIDIMEAELPPYRGIYSVQDSSAEKKTEILSMNVTGNFNNILSVQVICNVDRGGLHYVDAQPMNFDLNTGEEIALNSLLKEEGSELINYAISEKLDFLSNKYEGGNIYDASKKYLMLSAFKGIADNQKFYLTDSGINLVFDYTNSEFYSPSFEPLEIELSFKEAVNILDLNRYLEGKSTGELYLEEENKYLLVQGNEKKIESGKEAPQGGENLHFAMNCTYPTGIPQSIMIRISELDVFDESIAQPLRSKAASSPGQQYGYTNDVKVNHVGSYYNLIHSVSIYESSYWAESVEGFVYDMNGNEVELEDIFIGDGYEAIIKECIEEKLSRDFPDGSYGGKGIDELYLGIGFTLDSYGLQIKTQPIKFKTESGERDYEASASIYIPYERFGCDQMTIFN